MEPMTKVKMPGCFYWVKSEQIPKYQGCVIKVPTCCSKKSAKTAKYQTADVKSNTIRN